MVMLELSPEIETRLAAKAAKMGQAVSDYLKTVVERDVEQIPADQSEEQGSDNTAALEVLRAWQAQNATGDPDELERRREDWKEFKAALNENHTSDRVLFP